MTFDSLLNNYNSLKTENTHQKNYVSQREEAVRLLRHRQFAPKSEKIDNLDNQMLFNEIESEAIGNDDDKDDEQFDLIHVGSHTKKKPKRKKLPADLPR